MAIDSLSSAGYKRIQAMPFALQSIFENLGLLGSYLASIGDEVIDIFTSSKKIMKFGVQVIMGMTDLKYSLINVQRGLILISRYGAYWW